MLEQGNILVVNVSKIETDVRDKKKVKSVILPFRDWHIVDQGFVNDIQESEQLRYVAAFPLASNMSAYIRRLLTEWFDAGAFRPQGKLKRPHVLFSGAVRTVNLIGFSSSR